MNINNLIYSHFDFVNYESPELISWSGNISYSSDNPNNFIIKGEIGYSFDKTTISFDYDIETNSIWITSKFKLLHSTNIDLLNLCCIVYDTKTQYIDLKESIPYFRFPRSKDGIEIPIVITNICKVFQNDLIKEKPSIMIPLALLS